MSIYIIFVPACNVCAILVVDIVGLDSMSTVCAAMISVHTQSCVTHQGQCFQPLLRKAKIKNPVLNSKIYWNLPLKFNPEIKRYFMLPVVSYLIQFSIKQPVNKTH